MENLKQTCYTDGGCINNGKIDSVGSSCFIVVKNEEIIKEWTKVEYNTTNNRMEMIAIIECMKYMLSIGVSNCVIYTDSQLCRDTIMDWMYKWKKKGWKRGKKGEVKNLDLIKEVYELTINNSFEIIWVKGHSDNKFNNRCDFLCEQEMKKALS